MKRALILSLAVAMGACDQAPNDDPAPAAPAGAAPNAAAPAASNNASTPAASNAPMPVARIDFGPGRYLDIYEPAPGEIHYSEVGTYSGGGPRVSQKMIHDLKPSEIFLQFTHADKVPEALQQAEDRAILRFRGLLDAPAPSVTERTWSHVDGGRSPVLSSGGVEAHASALTGETGQTGLTGCPFWWFQSQTNPSTFGQLSWCNSSSGRDQGWCMQNVNWGFALGNAYEEGFGVVCTDSGTAQFHIENDMVNMTFPVPASTWRQHNTWLVDDCPPWWQFWISCETRRNRWMKYELFNGSAVANFGGRLNDYF
jgi:hypothetical protein